MMKKTGKYEKAPSTLKSYVISLLCVTLCCAMFMSTTFAWFTSDVTSQGNEIVTGNLTVSLMIDGKSIADTKVFTTEENKPWIPGDFQAKKMVLTNSSTIPIDYSLTMQLSGNEQAESEEITIPEVAKYFSVYVNVSDSADTVNVSNLTAESFKNTELWPSENVLSLYDVLNGKAVVSAKDVPAPEKETSEAAVPADNTVPSKKTYITMALMFNSGTAANANMMEQEMLLDVKLIASQAGIDTEASGLLTLSENTETVLSGKQHPMYVNGNGTLVLDNVTIAATKDGQHAIEIAPGSNVTLRVKDTVSLAAAEGGYVIYVNEGATLNLTSDITVNGNVKLAEGATLIGGDKTVKNAQVYLGESTTVKNVKFDGVCSDEGSQIYAPGVSFTVQSCEFKNSNWDAIQSTPVPGNQIVIDGCTFADYTTETSVQKRGIHVEASYTADGDGDGIPDAADKDNNIKVTITNCHLDLSRFITGAKAFANEIVTAGVFAENITASGNTYTEDPSVYKVVDACFVVSYRQSNGEGGWETVDCNQLMTLLGLQKANTEA